MFYAQFSEKKEEGKETDGCGWYDRSSFDSLHWRRKQGLTRRRTVFFSENQLYKKALSVVKYDGRQIAHGLCKLAQGVIHALARWHTRFWQVFCPVLRSTILYDGGKL